MVKKDKTLLGIDEFQFIKCLVNYLCENPIYKEIVKPFKEIKKDYPPEKGYLFRSMILKRRNPNNTLVWIQDQANISKTGKSLKRKKLIDIKTFEYKDSKGQPKGKKFREQIAFRLKKNSKVFGVILTNFLMRGEVDYFIQSDYYKESKNKSQDFFVELLEIFNLKSYFNELDNKYKQLLERWVLNEPTIMAYYITNPTQFKLLITKIQDAYKEKGIDPMMSVGIIISSFAVSSMFTQSYSNKKNKESISDYFLESIKEQATYLGASLEAYSQARIEVNKIQNKARSEQE